MWWLDDLMDGCFCGAGVCCVGNMGEVLVGEC